jgi:tetratricopeptide (TPR) repeat protein
MSADKGAKMAWNPQPSAEELSLLLEAGFIYRYCKRFREAREIFAGVRALRPHSEVPEIALGSVSFDEGDFADAIRHYRKALEINPRSAYAYAQLGEAQVFQKDKESARRSLKRALELDPKGEFGNLARTLLAFVEKTEFAENRPCLQG